MGVPEPREYPRPRPPFGRGQFRSSLSFGRCLPLEISLKAIKYDWKIGVGNVDSHAEDEVAGASSMVIVVAMPFRVGGRHDTASFGLSVVSPGVANGTFNMNDCESASLNL